MTDALITGNAAAAWGARLATVDYVPAFPITPQTEIIETLADWCVSGAMAGRVVMLESEHSMLTAAAAAAATGVRVFTATSSQGLLYAMEMLYAVPGWRVPLVLVNVSRGLATPITLESDHDDVLAARDTGCVHLVCATVQEIVDSVLMAHRISEDPRVRLPVVVNLDGFILSFTREPVEIPAPEQARQFLPPMEPGDVSFRASRPISQAVAVLGGGPYSYFRYETHRANLAALDAYEEIASEFAMTFGRRYGAIETYRTDDADLVFFMMGALSTKAMDAVDRLREAGQPVGLVRLRLLRPYPVDAIRAALLGRRAVAVIDQDISMGMGGVLYGELAAALYGASGGQPLLLSFIGGLGGRDISAEDFYEIAGEMRRAVVAGAAPAPRLLFSEAELRHVRQLQSIATVERAEIGGPQ
ncbi:MAG TPA: pyruvate synthase [Chloroflexota bacterium]|nr:pyruvate synthase [Chloroflexota bacterium]